MSQSSSLRALSSKTTQQIYCSTASGRPISTISTMKPEERSSIAISPPNGSPTADLSHSPLYRLENEHIHTRLSVESEESVSLEQIAWKYDEKTEPSSSRSRTPTGDSETRYRSLSPTCSHRRYGVIDFASFDAGLLSHHPFLDSLNCAEQGHDTEASTAHPNAVLVHEDPSIEPPCGEAYDSSARPLDVTYPPLKHDQYIQPFIDLGTCGAPARLDNDNEYAAQGKSTSSTGRWRCCECQRGHDVYRLGTGEHLISILSCLCKHRSCSSCTFNGSIQRFAPIDDVVGIASVPVAEDDGRNNRFGVVCRTCGLSWRAEMVKRPTRQGTLRRRLSMLPKKVVPLQKLRHTRSMIHLGMSRTQHANGHRPASASALNPRSTWDSASKDSRPGQARGAEVRFYGMECTCGSATDSSSLCFQLVDVPEAVGKLTGKGQVTEATKAARIQATAELRRKGHGTPILHLKGGPHPNPLASHPTEDTQGWM